MRIHKNFFEKTAFIFGMLILILTVGLFLSAPASKADYISPFVPFGGWVNSVVANPTPGGSYICPTYILITNADLTNGLPPEFGVYIPVFLPGPTYDYNNLFTPGTPLVGGFEPVLCPAPVPVYPLFYDAPFYLTGTGAF